MGHVDDDASKSVHANSRKYLFRSSPSDFSGGFGGPGSHHDQRTVCPKMYRSFFCCSVQQQQQKTDYNNHIQALVVSPTVLHYPVLFCTNQGCLFRTTTTATAATYYPIQRRCPKRCSTNQACSVQPRASFILNNISTKTSPYPACCSGPSPLSAARTLAGWVWSPPRASCGTDRRPLSTAPLAPGP